MSERARRILVVDDEPHIVHVVKYKLEQAGFEVIIAESGRQAYELACRGKPDVLITDFQMPGGSGHELAARLGSNRDTASIPILLLTARGHKLRASDPALTNIRCVMDKPFGPTDLIEKVNELLNDPDQLKPQDAAA